VSCNFKNFTLPFWVLILTIYGNIKWLLFDFHSYILKKNNSFDMSHKYFNTHLNSQQNYLALSCSLCSFRSSTRFKIFL